ncbi:hypothetical protein C8F01DRAFT_1111780 [Mycena amicta]|nr:hypothetical protein C8F01DRAFT_1111780 [Mycena amicta]
MASVPSLAPPPSRSEASSTPSLPSAPCMTTPELPAENDRRANDQQTTSENDQRGYHRACRCRTDACGGTCLGIFPHSTVTTHHLSPTPLQRRQDQSVKIFLSERLAAQVAGAAADNPRGHRIHIRVYQPPSQPSEYPSPYSCRPPLDDNHHARRRRSASTACPSPSGHRATSVTAGETTSSCVGTTLPLHMHAAKRDPSLVVGEQRLCLSATGRSSNTMAMDTCVESWRGWRCRWIHGRHSSQSLRTPMTILPAAVPVCCTCLSTLYY